MLPVGLCSMSNVHPIPTIMFKSSVKILEAEILKIFLKQQNLDVLIKTEECTRFAIGTRQFRPRLVVLNVLTSASARSL